MVMVREAEERDDEAVVASCADPALFAEVFERRAGEIHQYLAQRSGASTAEELTAETFARAFDGRQHFDPLRGSARAWLYGIATNVAGLHMRAEGRRRNAYAREARLSAVSTDAEEPGVRVAERDLLLTALAQLDRRSQDVLYLLAGVGLTYEETAHALGIPIGTVRSRYSRARARIIELLDPETTLRPAGTSRRRRQP